MDIVPWFENLKERVVTEGGKIIIKSILKKEDGKARFGLMFHDRAGCCEHGNEQSGSFNSAEYYAIQYAPYRDRFQFGSWKNICLYTKM
jgi:hypothetical protein